MSGESPWLWIFTGALIGGLGGFLLMLGSNEDVTGFRVAGLLAVVVGGLVVQVAVIAAGVAMGMERYDRLTGRDPLR